MSTETEVLRPESLELSRPTWLDDRRLMIQYSGDPAWHKRLIVQRITGQEFIIVTPDHDVYIEAPPINGSVSAYLEPASGGRPSSVPAADELYLFETPPTPVEKAEHLEQSEWTFDNVKTVLMHRAQVLGLPGALPAPPAGLPAPVPRGGVPGSRPPHCTSHRASSLRSARLGLQ